MKHGLLLFAHGARDPQWSRPFVELARQVEQLEPAALVRLAFLEFMQPTLALAGAQLCAAGCQQVDVVPVFLGTGGHVRRDLPVMLADLSAKFPAVQWRLQRALGERDAVIHALAHEAVRCGHEDVR